MTENPFNRSGFASLDDLATQEWRTLFEHLESVQAEFIAAKPHCEDYPWPKDPLHNWIRVWEYPFVYHHLQRHRPSITGPSLPQIVDLGSGATFIPFAVARQGYSVIAVDADARAKLSVDRAIGVVSAGPGTVTSLLADARSIPLETGSVDGVFCISVLEHIPHFEDVIAEVRRILRPGGVFVLTFDVDLRGNWELGPTAYGRLMQALNAAFFLSYPEKVIHPLLMLSSDNSPYPMYADESPLHRARKTAKDIARPMYRLLRGLPQISKPGRLLVSSYGACLWKKNTGTETDPGERMPPYPHR